MIIDEFWGKGDDVQLVSALWVPVSEDVEQVLSVWREKYDPSYELYPTHISLVYGGFIPVDGWSAARPRLEELLKNVHPFEISLQETGVFEGNPCTLWLKPEDQGELRKIRQLLEENLPEWVHPLPFPFQPHLTIGFFTDSEGLEKVRKRFNQEFCPISFSVKHLDFIYRHGSELVREHLPLP